MEWSASKTRPGKQCARSDRRIALAHEIKGAEKCLLLDLDQAIVFDEGIIVEIEDLESLLSQVSHLCWKFL